MRKERRGLSILRGKVSRLRTNRMEVGGIDWPFGGTITRDLFTQSMTFF